MSCKVKSHVRCGKKVKAHVRKTKGSKKGSGSEMMSRSRDREQESLMEDYLNEKDTKKKSKIRKGFKSCKSC